jgi:hypothetical protein
MRNTLILINCLLIAACATPREACIQTANRDLSVVRALISESEATLKRGYAIQTTSRNVIVSQPCFTKKYPNRWCERYVPVTDKKAVAVDLAAEKRKLRGLRVKEKQLRIRSAQDIQTCRITYPE